MRKNKLGIFVFVQISIWISFDNHFSQIACVRRIEEANQAGLWNFLKSIQKGFLHHWPLFTRSEKTIPLLCNQIDENAIYLLARMY